MLERRRRGRVSRLVFLKFQDEHIQYTYIYIYIYIERERERERERISTKISSLPNRVLMKSAREAILAGLSTSSWWKRTRSERPESFSFWTASRPFFSSLAVSTTLTPFEANCLTVSNPIPLLDPVTTAYLTKWIIVKILQKKKTRETNVRECHISGWRMWLVKY